MEQVGEGNGWTYMCPSLEDEDVLSGTFAVSECAHGLGALVFEACEELVEVLGAEGLEEPFAAYRSFCQLAML